MILLVEDNPDDELLTIDALRSGGVQNPIAVARDGAEALDYVFAEGTHATRTTAEAPLLILLDLKLPKIGGLEVLRRLRSDERTRLIPVVVLTSSSERADINGSYSNGANGYVRKPVGFEEFLEAVRCLGLYWIRTNEPPEK